LGLKKIVFKIKRMDTMKLSEIEDMWAVDCLVNKDHLDTDSIIVYPLHFKYHKILSAERIKFKAMTEKKKLIVQKLDDYYNGKIDGPSIGREPWQLKDSKVSAEKRVESDQELIDFNLQMFAQEEKVLLLKEILSTLNNRSFGVGNAIKFMAFMKGESL
jgi:hypothetical protein